MVVIVDDWVFTIRSVIPRIVERVRYFDFGGYRPSTIRPENDHSHKYLNLIPKDEYVRETRLFALRESIWMAERQTLRRRYFFFDVIGRSRSRHFGANNSFRENAISIIAKMRLRLHSASLLNDDLWGRDGRLLRSKKRAFYLELRGSVRSVVRQTLRRRLFF